MIPHIFHGCSIDVNDINEGAVYTPTISWRSWRASVVVPQVDNIFYLDPHHTRTTDPLRPPTQTQTTERECERGILATIIPRRRPRPAAQAHRHSYTRPPHHRPYQNN